MDRSSERWQEINPSRFSWEREALSFIREALPDAEPYRACGLKFAVLLPDRLARLVVERRVDGREDAARAVAEPMLDVSGG